MLGVLWKRCEFKSYCFCMVSGILAVPCTLIVVNFWIWRLKHVLQHKLFQMCLHFASELLVVVHEPTKCNFVEELLCYTIQFSCKAFLLISLISFVLPIRMSWFTDARFTHIYVTLYGWCMVVLWWCTCVTYLAKCCILWMHCYRHPSVKIWPTVL